MFSIIIAVYNNEKYFPVAVESVLSQEFEDFELIIVDDGSTDNTGKIADTYAELDSRIKVIHQNNQWIYASFNRGIQEARGEYVYILNSDDRLRPGTLSLMADRVERYHPDVIWTVVLTHKCDREQNIIDYDCYGMEQVITEEKYFSGKNEVRNAWPLLEQNSLAHNQANLYKRELMLKHPFRNDVYGADVLFNISLAPDVNTAVVLDVPVYDHFIYNREDMNASIGKYYDYEHDMFNEIYEGYMSLFESWELDKSSYEEFLSRRKLNEITAVIKRLKHPACRMSRNEKAKTIFTKFVDDNALRASQILHCEEELESRVLSGLRELLLKEPLREDDEMYFAYELLESLLRYEKDEEDYRKIENAIKHHLNPKGIGKIFYNKLL